MNIVLSEKQAFLAKLLLREHGTVKFELRLVEPSDIMLKDPERSVYLLDANQCVELSVIPVHFLTVESKATSS